MAKIISQKNKGLTLIELLVYMGIFSIICLMVSSSVFYLQKIIQNNNQNYFIKNQVYYNLNILQQYLYYTRVEIKAGDLNFFDKNNMHVLTQKIENKQVKNIYKDKSFVINDNLNLEKYDITFTDKDRLIRFDISWVDNRGKTHNFTEYLVVINHNM